jgi:iron complex transport system substrate-binding protein
MLVGRSHECDYPAWISRLPVCTETKFCTDGTSYQIDQRIKAILQEGLSVYRVLAAALQTLHPTTLITQTQCEVCAVSLRDVEDAVCQLVDSRPSIVSLEPHCLADLWEDIQRVADALHFPERGVDLIRKLKFRMQVISGCAASLPSQPKVSCIEWIDPLMAAGNWMPELIDMAGGRNMLGFAGKHSPLLSWSELHSADPDIIIVSPCGFDMTRTCQEMKVIQRKPEWTGLRAVQTGKLFVVDGNQYFNRPGPRLVESLEILAEIIHPGEFKFGHQESGWKRL